MKSLTFVSAAIASAAIALSACAASDSAEASGDDEIVAKVLANSARVYEDRLEFPKSTFPEALRAKLDRYREALATGATKEDIENVILVGDREEGAAKDDGEIDESVGNPFGYIRRAVSWRDEGDTTIVMTEVASLEEAFAEFSSNGMVEIGGTSPQGLGVSRQALEKKIPFKLPLVKLDGKEIFREDDASLTITTGSVLVDATVDFGTEISKFRVKNAHLVVDGDVDAEMVMHLANKGPFDYAVEKEVFHKKYKLVGVGPVNLSMDVMATVACDVVADGDLDIEGGLKVHAAKFKGGVTYEKKEGAATVFEAPTFEPTVRAPEKVVANGNTKTVCTLRPKLQVLLFDRPGPAITPVITSKLLVSNPPVAAALSGSMSGKIAGKLTVFGKELASVDKDLPSIDRELWNYRGK